MMPLAEIINNSTPGPFLTRSWEEITKHPVNHRTNVPETAKKLRRIMRLREINTWQKREKNRITFFGHVANAQETEPPRRAVVNNEVNGLCNCSHLKFTVWASGGRKKKSEWIGLLSVS
jgi:hypothetical protein